MTRRPMIVLFGCLTAAACGRSVEPADAPPAARPKAPTAEAAPPGSSEVRIEEGMLRDLRITTAKVESRKGDDQVTLLGELAVDERGYAEVGVPVAARVIRLLAASGEDVREGQALLELQSPEVGRARSEFSTAMAHVTLAERALTRTRDLAAERIAPLREVEQAEAQAAAARSELRAAAAALTSMGLPPPSEGDTEIGSPSTFILPSPIRGTVIERRAVQGQLLDPGTAAFRVADLSTLWLTTHAFERDAVRVQPGTPARVTFAALPGREFTGKVTLVGRQVAAESRTIDVRIDVRNTDNLLRPGMSASATLPIGTSTTPILAVPVAAVQRVGENWCVFIPRSPSAFEIRPIGRGRDLGAEVEVVSGVKAGETIVVDGAFLLKSQAEKRDDHEEH